MPAFSVRVVVVLVFISGVVFASWQMDSLISKQDTDLGSYSGTVDILTTGSSEKWFKAKTANDIQNIESRKLANKKDGNRLTISNKVHEDPVDEGIIDKKLEIEDKDGVRTDHNIGKTDDSSQPEITTFFTAMKTTFKDVPVLSDQSIPTLKFLEACLSAIQMLTNMKRRIFDRVVTDVQGNIEKIRANYDSYPDESYTLQSMVLRELRNEPNYDPDDSTTSTILALKWLVRAFQFISRFMSYFAEGEEQSTSANKAYDETLRKHHGFVVRAIFKTAFLTLSTRHDFLKELAMNEADLARPDFEAKALADSRDYFNALDGRLHLIEVFFLKHDIEP